MEERRTKLFKSVGRYLERGWQVVPIRSRSKQPRQHNWTALRVSENEIDSYFRVSDNVGLLLGRPSGGLVDVDLDSQEAIEIASAFLPETSRRHGRASRPRSHWWYVAHPVPAPVKFKDVDGTCFVELRSTGQQTLAPPSIHPSGERVSWEEAGEPRQIDGWKLRRCVTRLAACALVARHWPEPGARHDAALALAGILVRNGWAEERVVDFVRRAARIAGDEEWRLRAQDVRSTVARIQQGRPTTGAPKLAEILGERAVERLVAWLNLKSVEEVDHNFSRATPWPTPLHPAALHGLAGDIVRTIEPQSEADPAALLVQFLVGFGNVVGRGPHFIAEADRHATNLFAVLVGATSKGRKGSSWGHIKRLFVGVDQNWTSERILQGLSSGEGLIWSVRDAIEKREAVRKKGRVVGYQKVVADHGVEDKRLLVQEPEFASVLRNIAREGNTLSPTLRQAWDTGFLHVLTKNSPAQASGAHVSVIGHITRDELRRYLHDTEVGNGFANRFLWTCARRSKSLPEGGTVDDVELTVLIDRVRRAIEFAREVHVLRRSSRARQLWHRVYAELSEGKPGLLGAVTSRAEAQTMRLACLYALLDRSKNIKAVHLRAALAVWGYTEASARFIFGNSLGDPLADELLRALRKSPEGLTRTEIRDLFNRNRDKAGIESALSGLLEGGLVERQIEETGEPGRPSERWRAAGVVRTTNTTKKPGEK